MSILLYKKIYLSLKEADYNLLLLKNHNINLTIKNTYFPSVGVDVKRGSLIPELVMCYYRDAQRDSIECFSLVEVM